MNTHLMPKNRSLKGCRRQRGAALFITILLITIGLTIVATLTYRHQLNLVRNIKAMNSEQAILLALSAESWAKSILKQDATDNQTDSLQDDWARVIPLLPVEGGSMTGCIIDLQSRFNLNNFGSLDQQAYDAAINGPEDDIVEQYLSLRTSLELEAFPEHAAVLVDWIDADSGTVAAGSAEDAEYSLFDPPRVAPNALFTSVSELATVSGYSLNDVRLLGDHIVVLPSITAVNVNTASALVLESLSTLIDDLVAEAIFEARPFESIGDFYQTLEDQVGILGSTPVMQQLPSNLVTVSSNFFELRAQVEIFGENITLTSLFQRNGSNDVRTLAREFEYIPNLTLEDDEINPLEPLCDQNQDSEDEEEESI